jgi:hypothetical protein
MMTRREWLAIAGAAASASCGYTLAGRGSFLPAHIHIIAVPVFLNRTPYPTVEQIFTEKVRVEFQSRGRYTVRQTEEGADAVVRGEIVGIAAAPVAFTDAQLATRFRFTVSVGVKLDDVRNKKTLWENPALSFSDEYDLSTRLTGAVGVEFLERERAVVDRLATDLGRNVVQAILEAF